MKTGRFSDRSLADLASGRPVIPSGTGIAERPPSSRGLATFRDRPEAVAGIAEIDARYQKRGRAARAHAEVFFDTRKCLARLLAACGP